MPGAGVKLISFVFLFGLSACRSPQIGAVKADFVVARPGAQVLEVIPTEGDADHVYYRIRFREAPGAKVREEVWAISAVPAPVGRCFIVTPQASPER
jgi:hypothetical protein